MGAVSVRSSVTGGLGVGEGGGGEDQSEAVFYSENAFMISKHEASLPRTTPCWAL